MKRAQCAARHIKRCACIARRAQLDLRQSKKFFAPNPLPLLAPEFLLRAARVYSATSSGPMQMLFLN